LTFHTRILAARSSLRLLLPPTAGNVARHARLQLLVIAYLIAGTAAIAGYLVSTGWLSGVAYVSVGILAAAGLLGGIVIHRPKLAAPWLLLAVGQACFLLADSVYFGSDGGASATFPSVADGFYLLGYPALAAGLGLLIRYPATGFRLAPLLDALAVGIALVLVLWVIAIENFIHDLSLPLVDRIVLLAYPVADVFLFAGAAFLVLATGGRGHARWLLMAAFALVLVADTLYSIALAEDAYVRGLADVLWLGSYMVLGLAALVPSMGDLTKPDRGARRTSHILPLVVAAAVVPLFAVVQQLIHGHVDLLVVIASEMVLAVVLLLRTVDLHHAERASFNLLRNQASILANMRESVVVSDLAGLITHWNDGAERVYGYEPAEVVGRSADVLHPDPDDGLRASQLAAALSGRDEEGDWAGRRKDGRRVVVNIHTSPMHDANGRICGVIGVSTDVTDRRVAERTAVRLATAIEQASEAVVVTNAAAEIEFVNPAFERITGYSANEVLGKNPRILKSGHQSPTYYDAMWSTLLSGRPWTAEFSNLRKDGSTYRVMSVISPIRDLAGVTTGYVAVSRDVTAERHNEQRSQQLARQRTLLAQTLREMDGTAAAETNSAAISRQLLSLSGVATAGLFIFTPDGCAQPYGFAVAGDGEPLYRIPKRRTTFLKGRAASGPWIAAWDDLPNHPYNDLFMSLGVRAIAYAPVRDADNLIGFLHVSSAAPNAEELLSDTLPSLVEFADICGALLTPGITVRHSQLAAHAEVAGVIRRRAFRTVLQPIVDLAAGQVVGYEALTRFADGRAPDVVLAEAAAVGLERELDLALVRSALDAGARLPAGCWLNLNVGPVTVMGGPQLRRLLAAAQRDIVLEITEHSQITDYPAFRRAFDRLGERVKLAVDDAGAGYASLHHILELHPAIVKLDRNLVHGVDADEARRALIAGIHHFTELAGCDLIAEGVETEAELGALREIGITLAQGYLLGRPAELDQVFGPDDS
jgi:PAS domain S-box-containing protein